MRWLIEDKKSDQSDGEQYPITNYQRSQSRNDAVFKRAALSAIDSNYDLSKDHLALVQMNNGKKESNSPSKENSNLEDVKAQRINNKGSIILDAPAIPVNIE